MGRTGGGTSGLSGFVTATDRSTRLTAARTRLVLDHPFLGSLVLQLPLKEAGSWCRTTATDARHLYYSPSYIDGLNSEELVSVLCHEVLHCALLHLTRRGHRARHRWDAACDYAVNQLIVDEDMVLPQGALHEPTFRGLSAEEIYPCLDEMEDPCTQDLHLHADALPAEGSPQLDSLTAAEQETLSVAWQARLARAIATARTAGQWSDSFERHFAASLTPRLPWRQLLSRYTSNLARDDYSYQRPSTRREGPAIYPSLRSPEIHLVAALDVSGSISNQEIAEFVCEINALKSTLRARITLLACDQKLSGDSTQVFEPWEELQIPPRVAGGGGTSFQPVFHWVAEQDGPPDLLLYFTDACGTYPEHAPPYPVLWLVKGQAPVPWGERIALN